MVADMHRLERAARLSMGDFETASDPAPRQRGSLLSPRLVTPLILLGALAFAAILLS